MRDINTKSLLIILLLLCSTYQIILATPTPDLVSNSVSISSDIVAYVPPTKREALEIIIGGGGGGYDSPSPEISPNCPPPPPPPCPPPVPPHSPPPPKGPTLTRVEEATKVILEFKKRVATDPHGILKTWQGRNACDYKGFTCTFFHTHSQAGLYAVQFNGFNFDGPNLGIDNFIDKLEDLTIFHANDNNFKGVIPNLSKFPRLYELDLSSNKYVGEFPRNVFTAKNLVYLDIRFNSLLGRVPPEVFSLDNLLVLFMNNNNFEQELPSNFGSTPVSFLALESNKFSGPIPKSIGNTADTLLEVLFTNNSLSGCLPYEIGLLKKSRIFDVSKNQLTGPIPLSFACLAGMQLFNLADNKFYGPVPELVCKLPLLKNLNLSNNFFTQVGPECMKLIKSNVLDVRNNCILGLPYQRSAQECEWFFKQPKYCPDSIMYNTIPCKGKAAYLESDMASQGVPQLLSPNKSD